MLEKVLSSEVSASRSKTEICEAREQKGCGSSWITQLLNRGYWERYPPLVKQQLASAVHSVIPLALVNSGMAQKAR